MYFEKAGRENTEAVLKAAEKRANELNINEIVVASTTGETGYKAIEIFENRKITVVTYHCGFRKPFEKVMEDNVKNDLILKGANVVMATHALSGIERAVFNKFSGTYPALLIADTLRLFGQGTKVAFEITIMAADAGALTGKDIISIGGTGKGADTAMVMKPANQSSIFDSKIREIICKPREF